MLHSCQLCKGAHSLLCHQRMKFFTSPLQKFVTPLLLAFLLVFFHIHVSLLNRSVAMCKGQHTPNRMLVFLK